jgi:ABC-2 type transport system ATP-binding protein
LSGTGLLVEDLNKTYGDLRALSDLSLEVRPGELFGFVGSNGAGKTTTMRIVLGVLAADSGRVLLDGQPVDLAMRRRIGYMPADRGLYPKMKVGEQLTYLARLHGMSKQQAAASVERWLDRLGVAERVGSAVEELSTGNQQRVQLAAALVHDPNVLVLDEPFSGLDPVAVDVMSQVLVELRDRGVPVLFSSHQLELVEQLCDRVGIIANGRMVATGTVEELRAHHPVQLDVQTGAPDGWASAIPGVRTVLRQDRLTRLELATGADDQAVLAEALRHGPVSGFTRRRPPLSELYREVVSG